MINIKEYIESGILEEYCLGLLPSEKIKEIQHNAVLYPEINEEIERIESTLMSFAAEPLKPTLKNKTMSLLENLAIEESFDIKNPPLINKYTDLNIWTTALKDIQPAEKFEDLKLRFLRNTEENQLCVAWLSKELVEEGHHEDEFQESFFIVEGTCTCLFGDKTYHLKAGDFIDIPFNTSHTIKNTSTNQGYVKALIQRKRIIA